jgi:hypothetical protein
MKPSRRHMEELTPVSNKLDSWLVLGYEKLAREYELSIEEVRSATITIKDGEITVKVKGKK